MRRQKPKTILVVDDDEITREGLAVILRREGYVTVPAASAEDALVLMRRDSFDLVLLDMMMSGRGGWGLLKDRVSDSRLGSVPVLILTALSVANAEWAASLGAKGFLRKPADAAAVLAEVGRCLAS